MFTPSSLALATPGKVYARAHCRFQYLEKLYAIPLFNYPPL
jgi:hypothetical protein